MKKIKKGDMNYQSFRLIIMNLGVFLLLTAVSFSQSDSLISSVPKWAKEVLDKTETFKNYELNFSTNPFYLEADFNGDKIDDIAFLISSKYEQSSGVLIINKGKNILYYIGCGNQTVMGASLDWAKQWFVYRDKIACNSGCKKKMTFKSPAIQLVFSPETSMIIYCKGKKYKTFVNSEL